ncbi:MAG: hypothetical protein KAJ14_14195 [Candidatus Omnitrophica bacterium]|nr:hypothetical protein [Candidatus Omnitrophota bacterium]
MNKKINLKSVNYTLLGINIILLILLVCIIVPISDWHFKKNIFGLTLFKESPYQTGIKLFIYSPLILNLFIIVLLAKEKIKNKKITLFSNIITFLFIIFFLLPLIFSWCEYMAHIISINNI